jgi:hypothetical protein
MIRTLPRHSLAHLMVPSRVCRVGLVTGCFVDIWAGGGAVARGELRLRWRGGRVGWRDGGVVQMFVITVVGLLGGFVGGGEDGSRG